MRRLALRTRSPKKPQQLLPLILNIDERALSLSRTGLGLVSWELLKYHTRTNTSRTRGRFSFQVPFFIAKLHGCKMDV